MKRSFLILISALLGEVAAAQTATRRDVAAGEVTGLEMGIEGSLRALPGGHVRWFVTVYEVVRGRELRPAAGVALAAQASYHRSEPVARATTDGDGRAAIDFVVPDDDKLVRSFGLTVEARAAKVQRRFDATVTLDPRYAIELHADRTVFEPGEPVLAWGRVIDGATGAPAPKRAVRFAATAGGHDLTPPAALESDTAGVFHASFSAPTTEETIALSAESEKAATASLALKTARVAIPALVVRAAPERPIVAPGVTVQVDVEVRTPDGRPVPRATLTGLAIPTGTKEKPAPPVLTDTAGRARVPWKPSSESDGDVAGELQAVREGLGAAKGTVRARVARRPYVIDWAVSGGALVPGVSQGFLVRVATPDGKPVPNLPVDLLGDGLRVASNSTDEAGFGSMRVKMDAHPPAAAGTPCAGETELPAHLKVGTDDEELCLPVDPDATIVLQRPSLAGAGRPLEVDLERVPTVASAPVELALLVRGPKDHWMPVAETLVAPGAAHATLAVPAEARGAAWLRARPLVGAARREVRGGSLGVWIAAGEAPAPRVSADGAGVRVELPDARAPGSGFVVALPVAEGAQLLRALDAGSRPAAELAGRTWAETPVDDTVSAVLRDGVIVPLAAPAEPVEQGRLRDPRREQERYVRGHLARVLRAIEEQVASATPDHLDLVAAHDAKGWRWNREIMSLVGAGLGPEALAGLDGSALTIDALTALDPTITFDNVARRITRERLWRLTVALADFVKEHELGYAWARRGDPASWLLGITTVDEKDHYDAWGRPFTLRPVPAGRARAPFLEPVPGWEIVSAGPDGREGTADDLADPFARVLASGSLFAEAMGEDLLLLRLQHVELGRATVQKLAETFEADMARHPSPTRPTPGPRRGWRPLPAPLDDAATVLAPAVVGPEPGLGAFGPIGDGKARLSLALASGGPRRYLVVAGVYGADGGFGHGSARVEGGAPFTIDAPLPARLAPGETVRIPVTLTYLGAPADVRVRATTTGPLATGDQDARPSRLRAGDARTISLALTARAPGEGQVRLEILGQGDAPLGEVTRDVRVLPDGALRAPHAGHLVPAGGEAHARLTVPADAVPLSARLVIAAPRDLVRDPGLEGASPALVAWAYALRGEPIPAPVAASLTTTPPGATLPALELACAVVAFGALAPEKSDAYPELQRTLQALHGTKARPWRERAAVLVALAGGAPSPTVGGDVDPVASMVRQLREESWDALASQAAHPAILARLAAGLLLADRRDAVGRELAQRARAALIGGALPEDDGPVDAWIGAAALAIAERQLGEDAVADTLARNLAPRLYLGLGGDPEATFWLLAASVYGVFGADAPAEVRASGKTIPLEHGIAVVELAASTAGDMVAVSSTAPVLVRLEARYLRPVAARADSSLRVRLDGDPGHAGELAAFELTVENGGAQPVARPTIEIALPGLASLADDARAGLAKAQGVLAVEPADLAGVVRVHLAPLGPRETRRLPVPVRWLGAGDARGLALTAYDDDAPWRLTTVPSQSLTIPPEPQETWR
jgi:hypothetical protein